MDVAQYQRAFAVFMDVSALPAAEQAGALRAACGDDTALRGWVERSM